eukprot:Rmarinus@m.22357
MSTTRKYASNNMNSTHRPSSSNFASRPSNFGRLVPLGKGGQPKPQVAAYPPVPKPATVATPTWSIRGQPPPPPYQGPKMAAGIPPKQSDGGNRTEVAPQEKSQISSTIGSSSSLSRSWRAQEPQRTTDAGGAAKQDALSSLLSMDLTDSWAEFDDDEMDFDAPLDLPEVQPSEPKQSEGKDVIDQHFENINSERQQQILAARREAEERAQRESALLQLRQQREQKEQSLKEKLIEKSSLPPTEKKEKPQELACNEEEIAPLNGKAINEGPDQRPDNIRPKDVGVEVVNDRSQETRSYHSSTDRPVRAALSNASQSDYRRPQHGTRPLWRSTDDDGMDTDHHLRGYGRDFHGREYGRDIQREHSGYRKDGYRRENYHREGYNKEFLSQDYTEKDEYSLGPQSARPYGRERDHDVQDRRESWRQGRSEQKPITLLKRPQTDEGSKKTPAPDQQTSSAEVAKPQGAWGAPVARKETSADIVDTPVESVSTQARQSRKQSRHGDVMDIGEKTELETDHQYASASGRRREDQWEAGNQQWTGRRGQTRERGRGRGRVAGSGDAELHRSRPDDKEVDWSDVRTGTLPPARLIPVPSKREGPNKEVVKPRRAHGETDRQEMPKSSKERDEGAQETSEKPTLSTYEREKLRRKQEAAGVRTEDIDGENKEGGRPSQRERDNKRKSSGTASDARESRADRRPKQKRSSSVPAPKEKRKGRGKDGGGSRMVRVMPSSTEVVKGSSKGEKSDMPCVRRLAGREDFSVEVDDFFGVVVHGRALSDEEGAGEWEVVGKRKAKDDSALKTTEKSNRKKLLRPRSDARDGNRISNSKQDVVEESKPTKSRGSVGNDDWAVGTTIIAWSSSNASPAFGATTASAPPPPLSLEAMANPVVEGISFLEKLKANLAPEKCAESEKLKEEEGETDSPAKKTKKTKAERAAERAERKERRERARAEKKAGREKAAASSNQIEQPGQERVKAKGPSSSGVDADMTPPATNEKVSGKAVDADGDKPVSTFDREREKRDKKERSGKSREERAKERRDRKEKKEERRKKKETKKAEDDHPQTSSVTERPRGSALVELEHPLPNEDVAPVLDDLPTVSQSQSAFSSSNTWGQSYLHWDTMAALRTFGPGLPQPTANQVDMTDGSVDDDTADVVALAVAEDALGGDADAAASLLDLKSKKQPRASRSRRRKVDDPSRSSDEGEQKGDRHRKGRRGETDLSEEGTSRRGGALDSKGKRTRPTRKPRENGVTEADVDKEATSKQTMSTFERELAKQRKRDGASVPRSQRGPSDHTLEPSLHRTLPLDTDSTAMASSTTVIPTSPVRGSSQPSTPVATQDAAISPTRRSLADEDCPKPRVHIRKSNVNSAGPASSSVSGHTEGPAGSDIRSAPHEHVASGTSRRAPPASVSTPIPHERGLNPETPAWVAPNIVDESTQSAREWTGPAVLPDSREIGFFTGDVYYPTTSLAPTFGVAPGVAAAHHAATPYITGTAPATASSGVVDYTLPDQTVTSSDPIWTNQLPGSGNPLVVRATPTSAQPAQAGLPSTLPTGIATNTFHPAAFAQQPQTYATIGFAATSSTAPVLTPAVPYSTRLSNHSSALASAGTFSPMTSSYGEDRYSAPPVPAVVSLGTAHHQVGRGFSYSGGKTRGSRAAQGTGPNRRGLPDSRYGDDGRGSADRHVGRGRWRGGRGSGSGHHRSEPPRAPSDGWGVSESSHPSWTH